MRRSIEKNALGLPIRWPQDFQRHIFSRVMVIEARLRD